jgi:hypothetical protein
MTVRRGSDGVCETGVTVAGDVTQKPSQLSGSSSEMLGRRGEEPD